MMSLEDRFWAKVDKDGPTIREDLGQCWVWTESTFPNGYAKFTVNSRPALAHRVSYEIASCRPLPAGVFIDHRCRNIICCRPSHLRPSTRKQNQENQSTRNRKSKSGVRGVTPSGSKWEARVRHNKKDYYLGMHDTIEQAAEAARLKRIELFTHNDEDREARIS